ncbi:multidrug effflux MFS transporter [Maritalea mediterranea]|uniref:Bcr/CflA family efflux transporter n=1 Tax=Maritalea mediterranea TaxID=2909667 RepID=A0ABS9E9C1_9HYPH|nr:multidrug effflux MFS transporter [Maritalea mediterranea]MCF4099388.1 multidrug effflux MFS transporter [Maritalea mediterranea]
MDRNILKFSLILGLMSAVGAFAIDMYLPALPLLAEDLNSSTSAAQMTLMVYFIAFGVSQLFYGPASDMFGRKKPIYFGLGLFMVTSIGCAFAPNIESLIALRFLQGIGAAAPMAIPRAVIRDLYTGQKATRMMSTIMIVIAISPMLAPLLGSAVIVPFGWRAVFLAIALATLIAMALAAFALPETLKPENRTPFVATSMLKSFGILLRDTNYLGLTFIGGLGMAAFFTFLGSASFVYMEHFGLTPTQFSLAFAVNASGFFVASQFSATIMGKIGPERLIRGATLGYATMVIILLGVFFFGFGSLPALIILFIIANAFMGLIIPTSMVLALEEHGPIAGAAASLGGTMQMLLGAFAMGISSAIFNGTPVPMLAVIALCGIGAFVLARITVRHPLPRAAKS